MKKIDMKVGMVIGKETATISQERKRWFKWLNHYAMGQPEMNIINNHSIYSQVFIIPIEDLRERFE